MEVGGTVEELGKTHPFARLDRYGELGLAPQPLTEHVRLFIFALLLVPFKLVGTVACLLSYFAVIKASVVLPESVRSEWVAALGRWHCRACLFCLGFIHIKWVKVPPPPPRSASKATDKTAPPVWGIVSNHCSWLDILVHMSHSFPSFVARDGTQSLPIVGTISQAMGCVYVNRSKRPADNGEPGVGEVVKQRMQAAAAGELPHSRPMLFFPEGTTTNGQHMLPFRTGAFLAGIPLLPVLLRYDTETVSPSWETIPAERHIFLILCNPTHSLTCYELPVYAPTEQERRDPRLYAANVRQQMLEVSGLKDSKLTFDDKMEFIEQLRKKHGLPPASANSAAQHTKQG